MRHTRRRAEDRERLAAMRRATEALEAQVRETQAAADRAKAAADARREGR
jgi:hypothetical protein